MKLSLESTGQKRAARIRTDKAPIKLSEEGWSVAPITIQDLAKQIPNLKVTERQREFIKAALRALTVAHLSEVFQCRVDI